MNYLSRVFAFCLVFFLAACGGGSGGSTGSPLLGGVVPALFTSAPASLTLEAGATKASVYSIGGGKRPYTVVSSDTSVVTVGQGVADNFVLTGVRVGAANITVKDASGQVVTVGVTTRASLELALAAPAVVSLTLNERQDFAVSGGYPPYSVVSSNSSVAKAVLVGTDVSVNALKLGSAQVSVVDGIGNRVSVNVAVAAGPPLFSTIPATLSLLLDASQPYRLGGGIPPYDVRTSNPGVLSATLNGVELTVRGMAVGTSSIIVTDAAGTAATLSAVSVNRPTSTPLAAIPAAVTAAVGDRLTFSVVGGTPDAAGLYSIRSNNSSIVTAPSVAGTTFTAALVAPGSTVLTIVDSAGQVQNISVTSQPSTSALFTTAPAAVLFTNGVAQQFTVGGGAGGYRFQSSNLAVATVSASESTFTVIPVAVGTATVTVTDSVGAQRTFAVTVQPALPLSTTAPLAGVTLVPSALPTAYEVVGGVTPYAVASSSPAVVRGQIAGDSLNVLNITPVAAGSAAVTVTDAVGARTVVSVTVSPSGAAALTVTPGAAAGTVGDVLTFTVSGGTPLSGGGYTVRSNNTNILTVQSTAAPTFSATLVNAGSTVISVFDAQGQVQNLTVNVTATPTAIRLAPSAITIGENFKFGSLTPSNNIELKVFGGTINGNAKVFSSDVGRILVTALGRTITLSEGSYGKLCFKPADGATTLGAELPVVITVVDDLGASATMTVTIRNEVTSTVTGDPPLQALTSCE